MYFCVKITNKQSILNFFIIKESISFWWSANTAHGIHSPFVYNMVTKCLRNPKIFIIPRFYSESISKKYIRILNRILNYYDLKKVSTNHNQNIDALITQNCNNAEEIIRSLKNNQFWFVLNIRRDKHSLEKWKKTIQNSNIQVSIDLFQLGIILKREQQTKENFKLKVLF